MRSRVGPISTVRPGRAPRPDTLRRGTNDPNDRDRGGGFGPAVGVAPNINPRTGNPDDPRGGLNFRNWPTRPAAAPDARPISTPRPPGPNSVPFARHEVADARRGRSRGSLPREAAMTDHPTRHGPAVALPGLRPLSSFRFFAAVAVVVCHRPHPPGDAWLPYERNTGAVVTFFFLLSGFILAYTAHDRFVSRKPGAARAFLTARLARLLPAYFVAFALAVWTCAEGRALLSGTFGLALWQAVAHLTLTQSLVPDMRFYFGFNPAAWSLSTEFCFYLAFPLLLFGLATGPLWRRAAVFALASAGWATAWAVYLRSDDPLADYFLWAWLGYVSPLTRVFDFACGVVLGVLFVCVKPAVGPAPGGAFWAWGVLELGAAALLWATLHYCPSPGGVRGPLTLHVQMLTWQGYYVPTFVVLVWLGAVGRGPVSWLLSWAPLVYLGELTYGVYVYHMPVLKLAAAAYPPDGRDPAEWAAAVMWGGGAAVLAVAALSYHLLEVPVRRWAKGRRPPDPPPAQRE